MTEIFQIAARIAFEPEPAPAVVSSSGLPVGLHTVLIVMICAAIGAMVLKRRLPGLALLTCLSILIGFGTLLAAWQTGYAEIALGGACVILGLYMLDYFSRVMASLENDVMALGDGNSQTSGASTSGTRRQG